MDCCNPMSTKGRFAALCIADACHFSRVKVLHVPGGGHRTPAAHTQDPGMLATPVTGAQQTISECSCAMILGHWAEGSAKASVFRGSAVS